MTFIDIDVDSLEILKINLEEFDLTNKCQIIRADIFELPVISKTVFLKKEAFINENNKIELLNRNTVDVETIKKVIQNNNNKETNIVTSDDHIESKGNYLLHKNYCSKEKEEKIQLKNNEQRNIELKPFDYCITNPPFGIQSINSADIKFLDTACFLAEEAIFSMHKLSTLDYLNKYFNNKKFNVSSRNVLFDIPKTYKFHKNISKNIEVVFIDAISEEYS